MSAENEIVENGTVSVNSGSGEKQDVSSITEYVTRQGLQKEVGSTPRYHLPRRNSGALLTSLQTANRTEHHASGGRVLVIDDQEVVRSILCVMLLALGYETHQTSDGIEGLESYARAKESGNPFDAVIIDMNITGGMEGKEVMGRLREIDPGVKAVVSSRDRHDPTLECFPQYGFAGALRKPYAVGELRRVMRRAISGHRVGPCDNLPSDDRETTAKY
jgi:CheY-like chemotaxis protein